jgi:transposase-like protein
MKYSKEVTDRLVQEYAAGTSVEMLAQELKVPSRSIIAKLSSLGVYKRKQYVNKRGEPPRKKSEYIEKIAQLLNLDLELCESLEKTNKLLLGLIEERLQIAADLSDPKSPQATALGAAVAAKLADPHRNWVMETHP